MAVELEGLEFQIEAKSTNTSKGIDALVASFTKLKGAIRGKTLSNISSKLDAIDKAISESGVSKLEGLANALNKLNSVRISPAIPKQLNRINDALGNISLEGIERVESLSGALRGMNGVNLPNFSRLGNNSLRSTAGQKQTEDEPITPKTEVAEVTEEISKAAIATGSWGKILSEVGQQYRATFSNITNGVKTLKDAISNLPINILRGLLTLPLNAFSTAMHLGAAAVNRMAGAMKQLAGNILSKIKNGFISLAQQMGKIAGYAMGFNRITKSVQRFGEAGKSAVSKLGQFFASVKRIAMYRLIRFFFSQLTNAMKEGINNLYQYSLLFDNTFSKSMDECATSFLYLKNSMAAMVAPIINTLAPALDFIISKVIDLLNLINKFFALLSGASTYTVAKRVATSYAEFAEDAAAATKKAAKEIKDATSGLDELNIISQRDDNGSGDTGTDFGSMFEELPIDSEFAKIKDTLAELFKPLLDGWNDYGQGAIDAFHRALSSIKGLLLDIARTWKDVWLGGSGYELISNILKLLTNILNLVADIADAFRIAWEKEGSALVQSIFDAGNAILALLTAISETFRRAWNDGTGVEIATLLLEIWTRPCLENKSCTN